MFGLRRLLGRAKADRELEEEIRFHLAEEARLRVERGESPEDAGRSARRDFGNPVLVREITREVWGWSAVERIAQDARYGWRMLWKSPAFTIVAVAALALGIGATTAIFTVVDAILVRPLPFPDQDRLVMVWEVPPHRNSPNVVQTQNFLDWRARNRSFEAIAALSAIPMNLSGTGEPEQVWGLRVSADFFPILRVPPLLGRTILHEEDVFGAPPSVVLSHGLWQRRYGGDPGVIGRKITVNGAACVVAGVMPPGFSLPNLRVELYVPIQIDPSSAPRQGRNYMTVARLRPGVSVEAAGSEMKSIAGRMAEERPETNAKWSTTVVPLKEQAVGQVRDALMVLFGAVVFVLSIACANVANLLLMRSAVRGREMTVRMALGASRGRLLHQLLIESLQLAALGGALGLLLAHGGVRAILRLLPSSFPLPRMDEIGVDGAVLAFTMLVSLAAGLFFGLVPGLQVGWRNLAESLHVGGRAASAGHRRLRGLLVVAEVAMALVLVIGAGLVMRSFVELQRVDPGFRAARVLTLRMLLLPSKYRELERRAAFVEDVLERVRALAGVAAAGSIHMLPLATGTSGTGYFRTDRPVPRPGEMPGGDVSVITPGYFRAMGIRMLSGRDFEPRDRLDSPPVAIINETAARRYFPGEDPIGKRLRIEWSGPPEAEIIGVSADTRHWAIADQPNPCLFLPNAQRPHLLAALVVRAAGDPAALVAAVKEQIRAVDPEQGVSHVQTMEGVVADSLARPRLQTVLLGLFGAIALVLACVGIYGVISYSVAQRTREIGVRLALGAEPRSIFRLVFREGLGLTAAGVAFGLLGAIALTRTMTTLLYGVKPTDPAVFAAVVVLLAAVAAAACYFPARRATRVDPVVVLREE